MARSGRMRVNARPEAVASALLSAGARIIDESGATQPYTFTLTDGGSGTFNISVRAQTTNTTETFSGVDDASITGSIYNDTFVVDGAPLAQGATLRLDGEAGTDALTLDLTKVSVDLHRAADGSVGGSGLTFAGIETVQLKLGNGVNTVETGASTDTVDATTGGTNTIDTGAGDDAISIGLAGQHTIDGGSGSDRLSFTLSGQGEEPVILDVDQHKLSNSTYQNVEYISFVVAKGNTNVKITGNLSSNPINISFYGRGHATYDTVDFDGSSITNAISVGASGPDYDNNVPVDYFMSISGGAVKAYFSRVDSTHIVGTAYDDKFRFAGPPSGGWRVNYDGGAGTDTLTFDLRDPADGKVYLNNLRFVPQADGSIESTYGTFANFERYAIVAGSGSYVVGGNLDDDLRGQGTFYGKGGDDTIVGTYVVGGDGDDDLTGTTASYEDAQSGVFVRITEGAQDTLGAGIDTLHDIANLVGSDYNDTLTGDTVANIIEGGVGDDRLEGGDGIDTLSYARATAGVVISLAVSGDQDTLGAGVDRVSGFENLVGSAFDDVLAGAAGDNRIDGGDGIDKASYATAAGAVDIDLRRTGAQVTGAGADTLINVEGIIGSAFNDTITGDFRDNIIEGGAGDDVLDGTTGFDIASYAGASAGVTVGLQAVEPQDTGGAGIDTLANFEGLTGSAFADTLTGNSGGNKLLGGSGDDLLIGRRGADELRGGDDVDTAVYQIGDWTRYAVMQSGKSFTVTNLNTGEVDTLYAIERLQFGDATFAIGKTVNVGPNARADKATGLSEAGTAGPGRDHASGNVVANDRDANLGTPGLGETLTVTGIAAGRDPGAFASVRGERIVEGTYGTLIIHADGSFDYQLDNARAATDALKAGATGRDIFTYRLADAHGLTSTAALTIAIAGAADGASAMAFGEDRHAATWQPHDDFFVVPTEHPFG